MSLIPAAETHRLEGFGGRAILNFAGWAMKFTFWSVTSVAKHLQSPARWLAVLALVFHVAWVPVHLLTVAHSDTGLTHHHGHSHGGSDTHDHDGDEDQHHFTGDHESKFLSKRQAILFAPMFVVWQPTVLTPPVATVRQVAVRAEESPPPADFSPPSGPRAPPLA